MTIANTETGEILDAKSAESRAMRIGLRLDTAADNFEGAMELLRAAIRDRDDLALGYRSPGDYLSDRFGGKLARLGVDLRREVVRELTEAGLSTRAIAPVVGVSKSQVASDQQVSSAGHLPEPPAASAEIRGGYASGPSLPSASVMLGTNTPQGGARGSEPTQTPDPESTETTPRPAVTGIDGKTYTRPEPKTRPRRPLADQFFDAAFDLTKTVDRIARLADDDRFPQNAEKVAAKNRSDLLRARDVLDDVLARMP